MRRWQFPMPGARPSRPQQRTCNRELPAIPSDLAMDALLRPGRARSVPDPGLRLSLRSAAVPTAATDLQPRLPAIPSDLAMVTLLRPGRARSVPDPGLRPSLRSAVVPAAATDLQPTVFGYSKRLGDGHAAAPGTGALRSRPWPAPQLAERGRPGRSNGLATDGFRLFQATWRWSRCCARDGRAPFAN